MAASAMVLAIEEVANELRSKKQQKAFSVVRITHPEPVGFCNFSDCPYYVAATVKAPVLVSSNFRPVASIKAQSTLLCNRSVQGYVLRIRSHRRFFVRQKYCR
jgi:hypothetical protein